MKDAREGRTIGRGMDEGDKEMGEVETLIEGNSYGDREESDEGQILTERWEIVRIKK